jgi:hypothetical protein
MTPQFIETFCGVYHSLFKDQLPSELEALRPAAGCGIGGSLLDHARLLAANGETGPDAPEKAMTSALTDRAAKGARHVEEHYCRKSDAPRAQDVRSRIEQAIGGSHQALEGLSRKVLKRYSGSSVPIKQQGLDDGVRF